MSLNIETLYENPEAHRVLAKSISRWQATLYYAKSFSTIPEASLDLRAILARIPSMPKDLPKKANWIEGYSTWNNISPCELRTKVEKPRRLFLRKPHPTNCTISPTNNFRVWEGNSNNGIALLTLGWAYVLSASLAERQGLSMEYGDLLKNTSPTTRLDLFYASPPERTWWKAIVGPGIEWSISGRQIAPWAVSVDDLGIEVAGESDNALQPPTATEAACYLTRLCCAFQLGNQISAALAAALILPLHSNLSCFKPITIELPKPSLTVCGGPPDDHNPPADFQFISHYMTLSICPLALGSSLWSVFWEIDVPSNLAGAWVGPIVTALEPILQADDMEFLVKVLSFTRIAPLWLGVALCGHGNLVKSILPSLKELYAYPYTRPNVDVAAWTGVPQTFISAPQTGLSLQDNTVSRADVWRLRHDCHTDYTTSAYSFTPLYGWPPFGRMRFSNVEFELRPHLECSHEWKYGFWTWTSCKTKDFGFYHMDLPTKVTIKATIGKTDACHDELEKAGILHKVSQRATEAIFSWCYDQVEEGFGGTVVPRFYGSDKAKESIESKHMARHAVEKWLEDCAKKTKKAPQR